LEEAPAMEPSGKSRSHQLWTLSARTESALEQVTENLLNHLRAQPETNLADAAFTLQVGRKAFEKRRVLICAEREETLRALENVRGTTTNESETKPRPVVFLFSGGGAQYEGMGWGVYQQEKVFREEVDRCSELLKGELGLDLRAVMYPGKQWGNETESLKQLWLALPALFVVEYGLAKLWKSWGIEPDAMMGHSIGEYTAACLAGVFTLEEGLKLVAARGRLMQKAPVGLMISVELSGTEAGEFLKTAGLEEAVSLAAVNGPKSTVLSGPVELVEKLEKDLQNRGLDCQRVDTSHAAHSCMMEEVAARFVEEVRKVKLRAPVLPYISNVSGKWITREEATDPKYWGRHLRQTVRFSEGLQEILKRGEQVWLEVGPGQTLSSLAKSHLGKERTPPVLSTLRHRNDVQEDEGYLLKTLGRLWVSGIKVKWDGFYAGEKRRRIPLPTYPFERQRYWIEKNAKLPRARGGRGRVDRENINEWFYAVQWNQFVPLPPDNVGERKLRWLMFVNGNEFERQLMEELTQGRQEVVTVRAGSQFQKADGSYLIRAGAREDYEQLVGDLLANGQLPDRIVHWWSVMPDNIQKEGIERFKGSQETGYYSLLFLMQALASRHVTQEFQLEIITSGTQEVDGREEIYPENATMLGLGKVIPQEYRHIMCRTIDVVISKSKANRRKQARQIATELRTAPRNKVVAYRKQSRWVQTFVPAPTEGTLRKGEIPERLRAGGVYLITGGLGKVGLEFGEHLVRTVHAKLVLIGRAGLPPKTEWGRWLEAHEATEATSRRICAIEKLEKMGAEVLVLNADVADEEQLRLAWDEACRRFGCIHGVIHAAGLPEAKTITELKPEDCELQFQSKVRGLYVLAKVLEGRQLDFCYLTSSLSAVLGGLGFGAYAAGNLFMDAFAQKKNRGSLFPWISVDWDRDFRMEVFFRSFWVQGSRGVVISTQDLHTEIDKWINLERHSAEEPGTTSSLKPHPRPIVSSAYVVPGSETEQMLAKLWEELFGIESVGIHDNFFELGGHSLLATQLMSRVRRMFEVELPLRSAFEAPTIASFAVIVAQCREEREKAYQMELLRKIESQTEEETEAELNASSMNDPNI
jgi:acyl transferase domain-containing protein